MDAMTLIATLGFIAGAPSVPCSYGGVPTATGEKIMTVVCMYDVAASPDGFSTGLQKVEKDAGAACHETAVTDPDKHQIAVLVCSFEVKPDSHEATAFQYGLDQGAKTAPAPAEANP